ncbi:Flap endonuclease GEN 1 [Homalodisca vitripennis]|nr:Flap endonuclease GEN 1 [Homalodisca vitripennis]
MNMYLRTSYLLLLGVKPVFILEGKAPSLKHDTIARRQQTLKESQTQSKNRNGNRGRLNCLQKRCEELLMSLGVRCYKSEGEAEALCSRLNELDVSNVSEDFNVPN